MHSLNRSKQTRTKVNVTAKQLRQFGPSEPQKGTKGYSFRGQDHLLN